MWYINPEKAMHKLRFLTELASCDSNQAMVQMGKKRPEVLHSMLQELREYDRDEEMLFKAQNVAKQLATFMLENPDSGKDVIWIIRDLLGHSVDCFCVIDFSDFHIDLILKNIQTMVYDHYPSVILARYVKPKCRKLLVDTVIVFADHPHESMDWASTGEACETLGFLNQKPEESMLCLGRHLNDGGCDDMPTVNIMHALPVFRKHCGLIEVYLKQFIREGLVDAGDLGYYSKCLSKLITSPNVAKRLLTTFEEMMLENDHIDWIAEQEIFDDCFGYMKSFFALYGQVSFLAKQ